MQYGPRGGSCEPATVVLGGGRNVKGQHGNAPTIVTLSHSFMVNIYSMALMRKTIGLAAEVDVPRCCSGHGAIDTLHIYNMFVSSSLSVGLIDNFLQH